MSLAQWQALLLVPYLMPRRVKMMVQRLRLLETSLERAPQMQLQALCR
jgi:hypothetical protein